MIHATNWLPGLLMVAIGLAAGIAAILFTRGRTSAATGFDTKRADLEHRVQFLFEQLRALDTERHQLGEARYAEDRQRLELETAEALRARDAHLREEAAVAAAASTAPAPVAPVNPSSFSARHPQLVGALWGGGVVVFFAVLGFTLVGAQGDRGDGEMTGMNPNAANGAQMPAMQEDPVFASALQRAKTNPGDVEAASFAAHELIRRQDFAQADALTKKALATNPFHVESRIHLAVLRATEGQFEAAMEDLGKLARTYPNAHEALLFRGALAMQAGNNALALDSFQRFVATAPADEQPPQIHQAIAMLRNQLGAPAP